LEVANIKFWNGAAFISTCTDKAQLVVLTARDPDGTVVESIEVVVGNSLGSGTQGPADPSDACTLNAINFTAAKSGLNQSSPLIVLPLKKPSYSKPSELKDRDIVIRTTTSGAGCVGELRVRYKYPHGNHFHWRTVKMKRVSGMPGTHVGKLGHRSDKYLQGAILDFTVQQSRTKKKSWGVVDNGNLTGLVRTQ
jgi:hypothetical protein